MNRRDFLKLSGRLAAIWGVNPANKLLRIPDEMPEALQKKDTEEEITTRRHFEGPYFVRGGCSIVMSFETKVWMD